MNSFQNCRLCLTKIYNYNEESAIINILSNHQNINVRSMLIKHCWFLILEADEHSQIICYKCWQTIIDFDQYVNNIKDAQNVLFNLSHSVIEQEKCTEIIKQEEDDDDDDDDDDVRSYSNFEASGSESNDTINNYNIKLEKKLWIPKKKEKCVKNPKTNLSQPNKKKKIENNSIEKQLKLAEEDGLISEYYKFDCEQCSNTFTNMRAILKHYRKSHKIRGYLRCCGKQIRNRLQALDHITVHKNPNAFRCEICDKSYTCKYILNIHMKQHDPKFERFKCNHCTRTFLKQYALTLHLRYVHTINQDGTTKIPNKGDFPCEICGTKFSYEILLRRHIKNRHSSFTKSVICAICANVYSNAKNLQLHHLSAHSQDIPKVQCVECERWFKNQETLRVHLRRHKKELHTCEICNREFPSLITFSAHKRSHKSANHLCIVCNKAFKLPYGLKRHMARHTGQLRKCPLCGNVFVTESGFDQHMKTWHQHSDDKKT